MLMFFNLANKWISWNAKCTVIGTHNDQTGLWDWGRVNHHPGSLPSGSIVGPEQTVIGLGPL